MEDELQSRILVDIGQYLTAMEKAAASTTQFAERSAVAATTLTESFHLAGDEVGRFAEKANVASASTLSLSGGFGALIGAGLLGEFINRIKESTLEIAHLSEASGASVVQLVELRDSMAAAGVQTERLPMQLTKLARMIEEAGAGSAKAAHMFHQLGIETKDWHGTLPNAVDVLLEMAHALQGGTISTNQFAAAAALLGRNTYQTVAFLKQGDEAIRQQMASHEAHARAVANSVDAVKQLQATEYNLSTQLQTSALPAFQAIVTVTSLFVAGLYKAEAALEGFGRILTQSLISQGTLAKGIAKIVEDAFSFHSHEDVARDFDNLIKNLKGDWELAKSDVNSFWDNANKKADEFFKSYQKEEKESLQGAGTIPDVAKSRLDQWKLTLDEMKISQGAFYATSIAADLAYWQQIRQNFQLNKQERLAVNEEIIRLSREVAQQQGEAARKAFEEEKKIAKENEFIWLEFDKVIDDTTKKIKKDTEQWVQQQTHVTEMSIAELHKRQDAYSSELDYEVQLGQITTQRRIQLEKDADDRMYLEEKKKLEKILALNKNYEKEYETIKHQLAVLDDTHRKRQIELDREAQLQRILLWKQLVGSIGTSFHTAITGVIQGTQTMRQAFHKMGQDILAGFVDTMFQMLVQQRLTHLAMLLLNKIFHIKKIADDSSAVSQEFAEVVAGNIAKIMSDAPVAAANAYTAYAWNPPLAAAMAGEAYSTVMGFAPLATAARGMIVDRDQVVMTHAREMILPAPISQGLQQMIEGDEGPGGMRLVYSPTINHPTAPAADVREFSRVVMRRLRNRL